MVEHDRGTRAHRIVPSMLQQSERRNGSFQKPADCRAVLYRLSSCANGSEELPSGWLLTSTESRRLGSPSSIYKHVVDAQMNKPPARLASEVISSLPGQ